MAATYCRDGYVHLQRGDMAKLSAHGEQCKIRKGAQSTLRCAFCAQYLLNEPRQLIQCGDRICGDCYENFTAANEKTTVRCPVCGTEVSLEQSFRDKACEREIASTTLSCTNPGCTWEGESKHIINHMKECKFAIVNCPNVGCSESVYRDKMEEHLSSCPFTPVLCEWCGEKITDQGKQVHMDNDCPDFVLQCTNGCGELFARKELPHHLQNGCPLKVTDCEYRNVGCEFRGNAENQVEHEKQSQAHHLRLVNHELRKSSAKLRGVSQTPKDTKMEALEQEVASIKRDIDKIKSELVEKVQPVVDAMVKVESTVQQLQEGFGEMALMVQTLQATSYSGTFIWKIPEVRRRRNEAKAGKTISLYSAPFYTSRHGYKLCLRLYMDGDGSGKGTHLSFFLTIMRGEYDALLPWPFRQTVTLTLLIPNQDKQHDIIQSFRPEPTSSSFQRPRNEMNVASGCPTFAPLSVLNNSSYVKDDTIFFKCKIDLSGLDPA